MRVLVCLEEFICQNIATVRSGYNTVLQQHVLLDSGPVSKHLTWFTNDMQLKCIGRLTAVCVTILYLLVNL